MLANVLIPFYSLAQAVKENDSGKIAMEASLELIGLVPFANSFAKVASTGTKMALLNGAKAVTKGAKAVAKGAKAVNRINLTRKFKMPAKVIQQSQRLQTLTRASLRQSNIHMEMTNGA